MVKHWSIWCQLSSLTTVTSTTEKGSVLNLKYEFLLAKKVFVTIRTNVICTFLFVTGYGVDSDFRNLVSSCPVYEHAVKHLARFVDICPLSKQVRQ